MGEKARQLVSQAVAGHSQDTASRVLSVITANLDRGQQLSVRVLFVRCVLEVLTPLLVHTFVHSHCGDIGTVQS